MTEPQPDVPVAAPPRRPPWRVTLVVGLVAALTAGGFFVLTRSRGPDVALALGFEEGTSYRYRVTMSFDGTMDTLVELPMDGRIEETVVYHVVEVAPDGAATIDVSVEDVSGSFAGQPLPPTSEMEMRMVIEPDGGLREIDGRPVPAALGRGWGDPSRSGGLPGMQSFPFLPDEPVGPGDEWVRDLDQPVPFGEGRIQVHSENEFVRYEDLGSVRTAVIESEISTPMDWTIDLSELAELGEELDTSDGGFVDVEGLPSTMTYRGNVEQDQTTWLDPDRGEMVRTELSGEFDVTIRASGGEGLGALAGAIPVRMVGEMQVTMERIEP